MDAAVAHSAEALTSAHELYTRAGLSAGDPASRPESYKIIGICLAAGSGIFIGISFVLKKFGLLAANKKYEEEPGEGYGYLKNWYWWGGMTLMILGEILNAVALAFTDAILVVPLGALAVVVTAILSAIFLKERLSIVGKVACFLCIVGSLVIVLNAPHNSAVANIQQMQEFVVAPGFLSYMGVVLVGSLVCALYAGPRWGKKNMIVYISICSWTGGLSVVAIQGFGAAVIAQIRGEQQFNQWFTYVVLVFLAGTLLTEIIYLNKALNIFNAALVTPTYYVYFTSTTIITSAILFRGFKGTAISIITVVAGFLTICAGVVLLQLSKSAKDVPDAAVFAGDLDQLQTIAEQEQSETDPKADAIRGTAAIVRRLSTVRQKMEEKEFLRLAEERRLERMTPLPENDALYEWDGLRRRKTILSSNRGSTRSRAMTSPGPGQFTLPPLTPHPPLGWSHMPTEEELQDRPTSPGMMSSIAGTIRGRAKSIFGEPETNPNKPAQSPMHPVQLTEIAVPGQQGAPVSSYSGVGVQDYGLPVAGKTEYEGSTASSGRRIQFGGDNRLASSGSGSSSIPPEVPPHSSSSQSHSAKRQFSFQNVFKRHQQHGNLGTDGAGDEALKPPRRPGIAARGYSNPHAASSTEEERLGLVKGDSQSVPNLPTYDEYDEYEEAPYADDKTRRYGRGITGSSPETSPERRRRHDDEKSEVEVYEESRRRFENRTPSPPTPGKGKGGSERPPPGGGGGAFI